MWTKFEDEVSNTYVCKQAYNKDESLQTSSINFHFCDTYKKGHLIRFIGDLRELNNRNKNPYPIQNSQFRFTNQNSVLQPHRIYYHWIFTISTWKYNSNSQVLCTIVPPWWKHENTSFMSNSKIRNCETRILKLHDTFRTKSTVSQNVLWTWHYLNEQYSETNQNI